MTSTSTVMTSTANEIALEQIETGSKKGRGRGMGQKSLDLIEAMRAIAAAVQPITGRGIGYKLFTAGLIPSMEKSEMQRVLPPPYRSTRARNNSLGLDRR